MRGSIRKRISDLPIRIQLTLIIFAAAMLVLLASASIFSYLTFREVRSNAMQQTLTATNTLAQDFVRIAVLDSVDITADIVTKLRAFPHIHNAVLIDERDKALVVYNRDPQSRVDSSTLQEREDYIDNGYLHTYVPITYLEQRYGTAYFRVSLDARRKRILGYAQLMLYVMPALLLLSFLVALYFQRFFTRPIRQLAQAIHSVSASDNYGVRLHTNGQAEIGKLFAGFNRMLERIQDAQRQLGDERERLHITLESIADAVITTDERGYIQYMNPVAEQLTGWAEGEAYQQPLGTVYRLIDERTRQRIDSQIDECLVQGTVRFNLDHVLLLTRDDFPVAVQTSIAPMRDSVKNITGAVVVFHNVTEAREMARRLQHQATHDALTELINRPEFENRVRVALQQLPLEGRHALLYLDLDQFKVVNDTCGHVAGDALLKQVAVLLRNAVRDADTVARLGGDEFAVLLLNCSARRAQEVAEKIRRTIESFTFVWRERTFKVGVSIGVVPIDTAAVSHTELMRSADVACYAAKDLGRNRIHVYEEGDAELLRRHGEMQWVSRITDALENDRLRLFVQRIAPTHSGVAHLAHYEVLLRLVEDDGMINYPGAFLPAAERYGLMPKVDFWVIDQLFNSPQLARLLDQRTAFRFNINLSGLTINSPELAGFVRHWLRRVRLPKKSICFEITETAAIENLPATAKFMREMKLLGCEFALDDFGSGVSSFAYLQNLPVDYLKIDGSFVADMSRNAVSEAMVRAINEIGHVMGVKTIAEVVEDGATYRLAQQLGIDYVQGYYLHTPCALEELVELEAREAGSRS